MSSGWGCPHEQDGKCAQVKGRECDPGMKGCVLSGRFTFANAPEKNQAAEIRARAEQRREKSRRSGNGS